MMMRLWGRGGDYPPGLDLLPSNNLHNTLLLPLFSPLRRLGPLSSRCASRSCSPYPSLPLRPTATLARIRCQSRLYAGSREVLSPSGRVMLAVEAAGEGAV